MKRRVAAFLAMMAFAPNLAAACACGCGCGCGVFAVANPSLLPTDSKAQLFDLR